MKKYEIHLHTEFSKCSSNKINSVLSEAKKKGLSGIAITDHNTIDGALLARKINRDKYFDIIIGEEISTDIGHVLAYYVKKRIPPGNIKEVLKEIRKQNAICILAHPYNILTEKLAKIIHFKEPRKSLTKENEHFAKEFDAIEGFNARTLLNKENKKSIELAKKYKKPITAGSDAHFPYEIGNATVEFDDKYTLRNAILNNKIKYSGKKGFVLFNRFRSMFKIFIYKHFNKHFKKKAESQNLKNNKNKK